MWGAPAPDPRPRPLCTSPGTSTAESGSRSQPQRDPKPAVRPGPEVSHRDPGSAVLRIAISLRHPSPGNRLEPHQERFFNPGFVPPEFLCGPGAPTSTPRGHRAPALPSVRLFSLPQAFQCTRLAPRRTPLTGPSRRGKYRSRGIPSTGPHSFRLFLSGSARPPSEL